jgi:hypothetical protein
LKLSNLQEVMATRARATFSYRINFQTVGHDTLIKMKEWSAENCQGLWRCESYHALYWQFEDEHDAMMFMLRWSGAEGNTLK